MHQNNLNFLAACNLQEPLKLLFKRCTNCQEVGIIAKVPYTNKQLLMNVINLLMRCGMYTHNKEDWDRKPNANKTWIYLRPFIQKAYQQRLQMGTMMAAQGRYVTNNQFAGLAANDEISDNGTAETIAGMIADTITSHMAFLSAQTAASLETNASQINASLQQLAANNNQLHQQQQIMMQQMAMLLTNQCTAVTTKTRNTTGGTCNNYPGGTNANPIYSAPPLHQ
jgi:hypothetical protein